MCAQRSLLNILKKYLIQTQLLEKYSNNTIETTTCICHNVRNYSSIQKIQPVLPSIPSSTSPEEESQIPQKIDPLTRECVEVQIPVPWGYIRGKWWGPTDKRPIFAPHGWQDNCGTFDRLAPLLPPEIGILAIDSPGHGLSSRYPHGFSYSVYDLPKIMRKLLQIFEWKKISLLGHSLGSIQSFLYSSLFPQDVDFYVGIDIMMALTDQDDSHFPTVYAGKIDQLLKYMDLMMCGKEPPSYPYEKCVEIYASGTMNSVTTECAPYLLNRGLRPSKLHPNQYYFSRDPRLKVSDLPSISRNDCFSLLSNVRSPVCFIKAQNSPYHSDSEYEKEMCARLRATAKEFNHVSVPGTHHVHLLTPEVIAEPISAFIRKYDVEDRSQKINLIDKLFIKKYI